VITHGNGLSRFYLQRENLPVTSFPDSLGYLWGRHPRAIGYMIQKASEPFYKMGIEKKVTTVVTQTLVNRMILLDHPTKPIGSFMSEEEALNNKKEFGWRLRKTRSGFRRIVPSPMRRYYRIDVIRYWWSEAMW